MNRALGTPFEMSLRILLLLSITENQEFSIEKIVAIDFIAVYALDFGLSDVNLHGNGDYRFSEISARRELAKDAIKQCVLSGNISPQNTEAGFLYGLSDSGAQYAANFESAYADKYRDIAALTISAMCDKTERQLYELINQRAVESLRRR